MNNAIYALGRWNPFHNTIKEFRGMEMIAIAIIIQEIDESLLQDFNKKDTIAILRFGYDLGVYLNDRPLFGVIDGEIVRGVHIV